MFFKTIILSISYLLFSKLYLIKYIAVTFKSLMIIRHIQPIQSRNNLFEIFSIYFKVLSFKKIIKMR